MKTRVISSIFIGITLLVVLVLGGPVLAAVSLVISLIGYGELTKALGIHENDVKCNPIEAAGYIGVVIHYVLIYVKKDVNCYIVSILFVFFAIMIIYVLTFPRFKASQAIGGVFAFIYAPIMLSCIYMLRIEEFGAFIAWVPFVAWISDSFAYLVGRACGKHKLCPKLSPNKTIEGSIGGVIGSLIAGAIFGFILYSNSLKNANVIWICMLITFVASVISQFGDLAASGIKRDHNIKDYGHLIPGHGGIMDRFDSVIFVASMVYFLSVMLLR